MNLITRDPFFGSLFDDFYEGKKVNNVMRTDIYEKEGNYIIDVDVPGFKKENVNVDFEDGYLTITAKREEITEENTSYLKKERHYGEFSRSYYVGNIDENEIKAKFEDGTLKITFPKEDPKKNVRQIIVE